MISQSHLSPAQIVGLALGVVYLLIGLVGFGATGFDGFASEVYTEKLLLFPINPLHNLVHVALGLVWMLSTGRHERAARVNTVLGVAVLAVAALGFLGVLKFLAIEKAMSPDNFLHLATGLLSVYFGTLGAGSR